jgi:hypothetical protein
MEPAGRACGACAPASWIVAGGCLRQCGGLGDSCGIGNYGESVLGVFFYNSTLLRTLSFCIPDVVRGPPAGVLAAIVFPYGPFCPSLQWIRPPTIQSPSSRSSVKPTAPPSLLTLEIDKRRGPFSLPHLGDGELRIHEVDRDWRVSRIECPRCHIKVIKTKSRKDDVYYKCPNHFKTVCCCLLCC